jgi:hypothetical protein
MNQKYLVIGAVAVGVFMLLKNSGRVNLTVSEGDGWERLDAINGIKIDHRKSLSL